MLVENKKRTCLKMAQKIFGYFEKSIIIDLIAHILNGSENNTLELYRSYL